MEHGRWMPPAGFHNNDQYDINGTDERYAHLGSGTYSQQPGHYDLLGPPDATVPTQSSNIDTDDIVRFVSNTDDAPYAAGRRPQATSRHLAPRSYPGASGPLANPHLEYHQYGLGGQSSTTASDSAYASLNPVGVPTDTPYDGQAFADEFSPFAVPPNHGEFEYASNAGTESVLSESVGRRGDRQGPQRKLRARSKSLIAPCWCGKELKNPSDAQKHKLQHEKPFGCSEMGCPRKQGFATQNDLQRHRGSVHRRTPLVGRVHGFICVACPAPQMGQRPKFWPRRDNFKAHVERKHPQVDLEHLIQLSASPRPEDAMTAESGYGSGSHIDTLDLACQQDLSSPLIPDLSDVMPQPGDYLFDLGGAAHGDSLAGVGNGAGPLADDSGPRRESDFGIHAADCGFELPLLSPVVVMGSMMSPETSFNSIPARPRLNVPMLTISHHGPEQSVQDPFDVSPWTAGCCGRPQSCSGSASMDFEGLRDESGGFRCPKCPKTKKRECDLRKHMKRHTRPYGCTFPSCFKEFGSRNDWKRHEESQHSLQEMWKCMLPTPAGTRCPTISYNSTHFADHLRQSHQDSLGSTAQVPLVGESMHLGAKAHRRYFCGFCNALVEQNPADFLHAAEARYKHIGDHYDQESCHVNEWVWVEADKPKGLLSAEERRRAKTSSASAARPGRAAAALSEEDDSDLGESGIPLLPSVRGGGLGAAFPYSPAVYGAGTVGAAQSGDLGKRRRLSWDRIADAGSGICIGGGM
ncbi:hypothetical protein LTS16_004841 [Friedmanniomyces endolithicus]|nr:hypothetical protein LTS16_004841 [Friedmanniomyces endolithicus]